MEEIKFSRTNEIIYKDVLSNGLSIYYYPNKNVKNFFISLVTKFGSIDTKFKLKGEEEYREIPNGLAHFLEHITLHLDGMEANDLFKSYGAYINAFTSFLSTSYVCECNAHFNECLDNLLYYVYTPYYTEETVKNEKGIIKEESKRCDDNIDRVFYQRRMKALFSNYKYREKIVGELDEIESITLDNINDAYNYFYHPGNMFLVISGNFDIDDAQRIIKERMDRFNFGEYKEVDRFYIDEPIEVNERKVNEKANLLANKAAYLIKIPSKVIDETGISRLEYVNYLELILRSNLGCTSLYFNELLDNKICNNGSSVFVSIMQDYFIVSIINSPNDNKVKEFIELTENYINNLEIDEKDIRRKIKAETSEYILSFDDNESVNDMISSDIIISNKFNEDILDVLNSFDVNKGKKILDSIDFNNKSIVVFEPKNS